MKNDITTTTGRVVGQWDGRDVKDLAGELRRIRQALQQEGANERIAPSDLPHREQLPPELRAFNAYPLWGCDGTNCLCGTAASRIVSIEDVRRYSLIDYH